VLAHYRIKPWNDCDLETLIGRGRESCAQFSSISAGLTSRPATELEPVAPRTFTGSAVSSLQQIDQTENKPSTSKRLVVSYRALPQTPVRGSACGSSPTAACWTSQAVRNTGRTRLNAGRPQCYGNARAVRDNGNERTPVGPGVPVAKLSGPRRGLGLPGEVHVPQ